MGRQAVNEAAPTASRIAEERRLFYVACTRARSRLVVTAVAGTEGEADQPSRFLVELGVPSRCGPGGPAARFPGGAGGRAAWGECRPGGLTRSARAGRGRLARLTKRPLTATGSYPGRTPRMVDPATPQLRLPTGRPARRADPDVGQSARRRAGLPPAVVPVRQAHAQSARSAAASFGSVIHVLTHHGARTGADLTELTDHLDAVWRQLDFDAKWLSVEAAS